MRRVPLSRQTRRDVLKTIAGGGVALAGSPLFANTDPFPNTMSLILGQAHMVYTKAAQYDPSNVPPYSKPGIYPPSILGNLGTCWQQLDAFASANGVYNQNGIWSQSVNIININPSFMTYALNQTQLGVLQTDYFSCIPLQDVQSETGITVTSNFHWGSDIHNAAYR